MEADLIPQQVEQTGEQTGSADLVVGILAELDSEANAKMFEALRRLPACESRCCKRINERFRPLLIQKPHKQEPMFLPIVFAFGKAIGHRCRGTKHVRTISICICGSGEIAGSRLLHHGK